MLSFLRPLFQSPDAPDSITNDYAGNPDALYPEARDLRDSALRLRLDEEKQWLQAWNYYKGRHWITWREDRWVESEANDRPKLVVNFIQHVVQTRLGHLIKNKPLLIGVPATADEDSRNAAQASVKILQAYHHKLRMAQKYKMAILHMLVTGKSYMKVGWDPMAGGSYERPNPGGEPFTGPLGDLCTDVCRVHEVLPEPAAWSIQDCQRAEYRTFLPLPAVRRRWGTEKTKDLQPIDPASREGSGMLRALYGFEGAIPPAITDRVEVLEVFYRAGVSRPGDSGVYENGLWAIFAGDKLMQAGPTPAGYAEIPLIEFNEIETDTIYSTSAARGLLDLNKIIDVELSHQEHNRKVHRPKTLVPVQAYLKEGAWDKTDDEIVEYMHPYKPEAYTPPGLPANQLEIRNALISLTKEMGGNFDVLSGKAQSDVRSGRMVAYLQEYAGTVLGVVAQNLEHAMEEVGNQQLRILQEYVREDRMESYVGRNRRMEVVQFKAADLKGCGGVVVQPDSAVPTSRAEKYDRIERWMGLQGGPPVISPEKGLKMLNVADPDIDLFSDDEQDRQIADEVCYKLQRIGVEEVQAAMQQGRMIAAQKLMSGAPAAGPGAEEREMLRALGIEAFEFENHQAIIEQVDRAFRKTQSYRAASPAVRSLADAFVDWHLLFARGMDPDNPTASLAAAAPGPGAVPPDGAPGPGGGPPPPPQADGSPMALKPGGVGMGPPGAGAPPLAAPPRGESGPEAKAGLPPVRPAPGPMHPKR
jgi:hypothetical protein